MQESVRSPFFSIIIPTKNRIDLLTICVQSVLSQTFSEFEVIIVDDHSQDNTAQLLTIISDPRLIVIKNTSQERSAARNTGIQNAKGKYICFIDDDDFISTLFLQDFYHHLETHDFPDDIILRTGFQKFYNDSKIISSPLFSEKKDRNAIFFAAYNMCGVWTLCIPVSCLKGLKFEERFPHWQDTYFILQLLLQYPLIQLPTYNYYYRIHGDMGSRHNKNAIEIAQKAKINIAAIDDFFNRYHTAVSPYLPKTSHHFLIAEKWMQYAIRMTDVDRSHSLQLFKKSLSYGLFWRNWKYYLLFLKKLSFSFLAS